MASRQTHGVDGTRPAQEGSGGGTTVIAAFTETIKLGINITDSASTATDAATFNLNVAQSESNATPTEAVKLGISGTGVNDSNATPTETKTFTMRIWLSATTANSANGVTNPANANGQNDGAVMTIQSAATGVASPSANSTLGSNVPSGVAITSIKYRGWFKSVNTLVTSNGFINVQSLTSLFSTITMFNNSALNTTVDHSSGDFTFDLLAAGVNTLAKLQSVIAQHGTSDAAAGVTPHVLTVDAGCIELAGAFT